MSRASEARAPYPINHRKITGGHPAPRHLRLVPNLLNLRSLTLRTCIERLLNGNEIRFTLSNSATGVFIYREKREASLLRSFYVGFGLVDQKTGKSTIYGRIVISCVKESGKLYLQEGYDIAEIRPSNECNELSSDNALPVFVAYGIKEGYGLVGTALMKIVFGIGVKIGATEVRILQSVSD